MNELTIPSPVGRPLRCKRGDLAMYVGSSADNGHPIHEALKGKVVCVTRSLWCPLRSKWMWEFNGPCIPVPGGMVDSLADIALVPILPGAMRRQAQKKEPAHV